MEENPLRKAWGWSDRFVILYSGNMGLGHEFETALAGISDFEFRISNFASPARTIIAESPAESQIAPPDKFEIRNPKSEMPLLAFIGTGPRRAEVEARAAELGLTTPNTAVSSLPTSPPNSNSEIQNPKSSPPLPSNSNPEIRNSKSQIAFHPPLPRADLTHSLTAPDAHLVTMREGMPGLIVPSKIYGILAAGKPTIYVGPAEGEIYDIITSGGCGIHVPIGDVSAFTSAAARYATDRALADEHGRSARRLFDARFTRARGIAEFRSALGADE